MSKLVYTRMMIQNSRQIRTINGINFDMCFLLYVISCKLTFNAFFDIFRVV